MDNRVRAEWEKQPCLCGNSEWCGRDRHRPDFAVDESNSTIFFDKNGEPTDETPEGIIQLNIVDLLGGLN